jgi:glucan phosphoethanolaminetransferase (alkaline phosphatase superfamily)
MAEKTEQNFSNHTRLDPAYHFVLFALLLLAVGLAVDMVVHEVSVASLWALVVSLALLLAVMKLRLYPLKAQDRIIRLEERLRMEAVLPESQKHEIWALTEAQVIALRFASDSELPALVNAAVTKKLAPKEIKQSIKNWRPDYFRV